MTKGTGLPRNAVFFITSAASTPTAMPSTYREIITSALYFVKNTAVKKP